MKSNRAESQKTKTVLGSRSKGNGAFSVSLSYAAPRKQSACNKDKHINHERITGEK